MRHWIESYGHDLTRDEVATRTGLPSATVAESPDLLRDRGSIGEETYPAAQFSNGCGTTPGIASLVGALDDGFSSADLVGFASTPSATLGGRAPLAWLQTGGDVDTLVRLASAS